MPPVSKVRATRTSSKRDTPSATSATSGSAPDDWFWSALDIARRAAMADDLEHVPSIKGIAEIFTRMLERLQGMKKDRDKFYVITDEIGSLIESVVLYARERESASERYRRMCDNFLRTISSMQSEMEQMFERRSQKAKAYQTVLSSYQFRVRSLHSDVQALTLSSPLTSSTDIFSNARNTTITGSTFTDIGGNQYIFHGHVTADIRTFPDQTSAEQVSVERIDDLDFSDYRVLKYGDLRAVSAPRRYRNILLDDDHEQDVPQEYTVRVQNQIMTARTYKGKSALQTFKDDVKVILEHNFRQVLSQSSAETQPLTDTLRHPHILQLFGMCSSSKVPTLVFHGDLRYLDETGLIGWDLSSLDKLCRLLQIYEECQEGQFIDNFGGEVCVLPTGVINFTFTSIHYISSIRKLRSSLVG
ncbi:hypothetical protein F5887DRAFT_1259560 [Amanita rubescens]|nr:hypothetical protein F5887DRAFT_1259560 [Amanita rubescens]